MAIPISFQQTSNIHDSQNCIRSAGYFCESEGKVELLKDVSIQLKSGEIAVLAGHNGSGKSTLLKAICGILPMTKGHIVGEDILPGYVPQSPEHLFVTQRVEDEILFSKAVVPELVDDIMQRLRLDEIRHVPPICNQSWAKSENCHCRHAC